MDSQTELDQNSLQLVDITGLDIPVSLDINYKSFLTIKKSRDLRKVIPAGKGRFEKGEAGRQEYLDRIRRGQKLGMKSLLRLVGCEHSRDWKNPAEVCIVGGGPTLADEVSALRRLVKRGVKVIAVNKSHDWLLKRGLPCHYAALLDPKEWVADYIDLSLAESKEIRRRAGKLWVQTKYLIASQCHDDTLNKFKKNPDAYLWHAAAGLGESELLQTEFAHEQWVNIAGASVIGLRAIGLAHGLGFRKMHLFGLDGSMKMPKQDDKPQLYAYEKPFVDATYQLFDVKLKTGWERTFASNHHMARSVYEFEDSLREWDQQIQAGRMEFFNVLVHGNPEHSAIAMVAAGMGIHADPNENEKYGNKPPCGQESLDSLLEAALSMTNITMPLGQPQKFTMSPTETDGPDSMITTEHPYIGSPIQSDTTHIGTP